MNIWIVVLIIVILIIGGIVLFSQLAPAAVEFHRDSLAPVRGLVGNPQSLGVLAALL